MPHRVSPTDRVRGHIDELFAQDKTLPEILEDVARLGAQLLTQAALEAEITEFLGQHRYQRGCGLPGRPAGFPQRVPGGDRQDHRRAGAAGPGRSCAARPRRSRPGCSGRT
jgi:hypothetical protein